MATTNTPDGGFRRWRRSRPFWGGLLLLIAGLELFLSANLTLGDLEVHMGPEGFLSYLLPLLLILAGVLTWVSPAQRLFYGILGLLTAVYSLVGLNLGGFGLGMLIGIFGGALVLSWAPSRHQPPAAAAAEPGAGPVAPDGTDQEPGPAKEHPYGHDPAATMIVPGFTGGPDDRGSHDPGGEATPLRPARQAAPTEQFPGQPAYPGDERPPSGGIQRNAFVILLIPLVMTAALLIAGGQTPARAATECPAGLPSRPAAAAKKEAARQSRPRPKLNGAPVKKAPEAGATPSASASASASPAAGDDTGNPIVDGWNGFVDGVGDLLGINDDEKTAETPDEAEPTPSTSAAAPATADPSASAAPSSPAPAESGGPEQSGAAEPSAAASSPTPTPSESDIPCLGPRVYKDADPDDVPLVSRRGSILRTKSLTMYNSTYDGVIELDTVDNGKLQALKFSMSKAVNEPFTLTVPEAGGGDTLVESNKLTTDGNVRFYTPEFKGKLFGIIPVTFTPKSPPPLTLPVLWFTDVTINLAFVRCDTLSGEPMKVSPKA